MIWGSRVLVARMTSSPVTAAVASRGANRPFAGLIDEPAELLDGHDRVDTSAKGRQNSSRVEEGIKRLDRRSTLNRDVTQREFVVEGELTESVVQRRFEESAALLSQWRRAHVDTSRRTGLVVRKSRDEIPEFGERPDRRCVERSHTVKGHALHERAPVEFVVSRERVVADVQPDVAEEFGPGLHAMTRFATRPKRPHGRCARSLKNVSPPSVV